MPDYSKGKIYKIVNDVNDKVYYGSTIQKLCYRMCQHRDKHNHCMSKKLNVNIKECKIILVENINCKSKEELEKRERWYIENNECVNKRIPGRTTKEYYEENKHRLRLEKKIYSEKNKEKIQQYREENKEKIAENNKKYYKENKEMYKKYSEENKEKISLVNKKWCEANKEKLAEKKKKWYEKNKAKNIDYKKKWYEKNKAKRTEKATCECGAVVAKCSMTRHKKSKKHLEFIDN
tara:strand:+ start:72 stop:776 length:705 start_codon:yes stop_codon:yes gene_type:complete